MGRSPVEQSGPLRPEGCTLQSDAEALAQGCKSRWGHQAVTRDTPIGSARSPRYPVRFPYPQRAAPGTVREHQRRLPAAPGSAAALRVVGRGRRDIAQVDEVELGD